ncbi:hypothetical protein OG203_15600 [Nocardia sp. NBC_01499]|uniref:hypothetical protein n=1 Tax=Nocardia sp. NBC_01499 TaxID=2903597 RepID=UPI00386B3B60
MNATIRAGIAGAAVISALILGSAQAWANNDSRSQVAPGDSSSQSGNPNATREGVATRDGADTWTPNNRDGADTWTPKTRDGATTQDGIRVNASPDGIRVN